MIEKRPDPTSAPDFVLTPAAQLQRLGWSFKPRYEDHDTTKPIIGVRLTNCAKIFESAQTIQILDQRTVTVQFGFLQEQSVSLTDEDGALFIEWLKAEHPDLAAPMLAVVPAGDPTPGASKTGLNTTKARLVEYLAEAYPDTFAKGGRASQPGADFYTELLALFYDPDRDAARRVTLILAAENMAHDLYADCNATLRQAARAQSPEARAELQMDAYGRAIAAERARAYAKTMRGRLAEQDKPPAPAFPEEVEPQSIPVVQSIRALNPIPGQARPHGGIPPASDSLATNPEKIRAGVMVGVIDPIHPNYRQMGEIINCVPGNAASQIAVTISGSGLQDFKATQLMAIA